MPVQQGKKKVKTDKRDARKIAKCLAHHDYSAVHVPTAKDEETKEFIRMRDDHKLALKKIKQQILAFCLRHNYGMLFGGTYIIPYLAGSCLYFSTFSANLA